MTGISEPFGRDACACTSLRKASRAVSRLYEDRFAETGMTITQFSVLRALDQQPDQALSRLAEAMVMDRTSLYRMIAPLERQGFLTITAGPGRSRIASLAEHGRAAIDRAAPIWDAAQAEFLDRFGRDAWTRLESTLSDVVATAAQDVRG